MKKITKMICLMLAAVFMFTACGSKAEIPEIDGYVHYTDEGVGIDIQYPETWMLVDAQLMAESDEMEAMILEAGEYGLSMDFLQQSLATSDAIWYDFDNTVNDITANVNLVSMEAQGIKQSQLKDENDQKELAEMLMAELAMYATIEEIEPVQGKDMGNNYFIVLKYNYNMFGMDLSSYQAMTCNNRNKLMVFTYVCDPAVYNDGVEKFETMLSTLDFTN